ncbi:MAG: bifunctional hydroxymethylpyrimidine kinase/phosphomethylpyrimidine kinase [Desulfobulbaceae bacterium]
MEATILSIAGSDPTGGAGLQADLKTLGVLGVYGAGVVTCITVQNSHGVKRVEPLAPDLVEQQIEAVLDDHHVTHIKTGMIGTGAIARAAGRALKTFSGEVVVDPVLLSTTGQELYNRSDIDTLKEEISGRATVLTPNLPELSTLVDKKVTDAEEALEAAGLLLEEFPNLRAVLVKGGHLEGGPEVSDLLLHRSAGSIRLVSSTRPLVTTRNTHGTGCVLATAFAAFHSLTGEYEQAFYRAAGFIQRALEWSRPLRIVRNPEGRGGLLLSPRTET